MSPIVARYHSRYLLVAAVLFSALSLPGQQTYQGLPANGRPLQFEANTGQTDPGVRFLARGPRFTLFLSPGQALFDLRGPQRLRSAVRMRVSGANLESPLEGLDPLSGTSNYQIGNDPSRWRRNITNFGQVRQQSVYPGIDLVYYGHQGRLEYDFLVAPHANPKRIALEVNGARRVHIDRDGDLVIETAVGSLKQPRPVAYQVRDGLREIVAVSYQLRRPNQAGFVLGKYDQRLPLTIDPVLDYSSFLGGSGEDQATAVANDGTSAYVVGVTNSLDFPTATQPTRGGLDIFIARVDPAFRGSVSVTFIGGSGDDRPNAVSLSSGRLAIAGETNSRNFPTAAQTLPFQANYGGGDSDAFVLQLDTRTGTLISSTYLGGTGDDRAFGVALDFTGRAVVTGSTTSPNFPTQNALQPSLAGATDAFVTSLAGRTLVYSTFLGGSGEDKASAVTLGPGGEAYVAGETSSGDFPVSSAFQRTIAGGVDAFIAKLTNDGSALAFSTYLGGAADDRATGIGLDSDLNIFVAGTTGSSNFPTAKAAQNSFGGGASDAFLTRFGADGQSLVYSTYLGGSGDDAGFGVAVAGYGDAYVVGSSNSTDFPAKNPLQGAFAGGSADAFLVQAGADGAIVQATLFGGTGADQALGVAVDSYGSAWIVGRTDSADLPSKLPVQTSFGGRTDAFAARISNPGIVSPNLSIGKDLEAQGSVALGIPAPVGGVQVTLTSSDPAKLLFSRNSKDEGSSSVSFTVDPGAQLAGTFYAHALSDSGIVPYTVSAPAYITRTGNMTLTPSGFLPLASSGFVRSFSAFTTTTLSPNTSINVVGVRLAPGSLRIAGLQNTRGGLAPLRIEVSSSDLSVGTITSSPVSLEGGLDGASTEFRPKGIGTSAISVTTPQGFSAPATDPLIATVIAPKLSLRNVTVGKDLQVQTQVDLTAPAPAGTNLLIKSANPAQVLVSADPAQPGAATLTLPLQNGAANASFYVQGLADNGTAGLEASAQLYDTGSGSVTLTPSGFYMNTPAGFGGDFTTTLLSSVLLGVYPAQLDPSTLSIRNRQSLRPGLGPVQVSLTSSNPQVGSVLDSPLIFNTGDNARQTQFQPRTVGTTDLTVGVPAGFAAPSSGRLSKITVVPPAVKLNDLTVGRELQVRMSVSLTANSPTSLNITVTSSDPSRVLLATAPNVTGAAQVVLSVSANSSFVSDLYVQGLAGSGSAQLTATASGFASGNATVRLGPSGFIFDSFSSDLRTTLYASNLNIQIYSTLLDPTTNEPVSRQDLRGGLAGVGVEVSSSAPGVGAVSNSPIAFLSGQNSQSAQFRPAGLGVTALGLVTPAGFSTPAKGREVRVAVSSPALNFQSSYTVGKNLQIPVGISLPVTPPVGLSLTVTSADPSKVLLSLDNAATGSASVTLRQGSGFGFPQFFVQALDSEGSVGITASAPDFTDATSTVALGPSGFVLSQSLPLTQQGIYNTTTISSNATLNIVPVVISPAPNSFPQQQQLRGGLSAIAVPVTSTNPSVGKITSSPLIFNGGDSTKATQFQPVATGTTDVVVGVPEGFGTFAGRQRLAVNVTRPGLVLEQLVVGKNLQRPTAVSMAPSLSAPGSGLSVTITSSDPTRLLLSASARAVGAATLVVSMQPGSFRSPDFFVQALAGEGVATLSATADGFAETNNSVTLVPSGFGLGFFSSEGARTTTFADPLTVSIYPTALAPGIDQFTARQSLRAGLDDVPVQVSSSDSAVAQLIGAPLVFHQGDSTQTLRVQPVAPGVAVVSIATPDGFSSAPGDQAQLRITVTAPQLSFSLNSGTVGKDLQTSASVSLPVQPKDPPSIIITSSDPEKVRVSTNRTDNPVTSITLARASGFSNQFFVHGFADQGSAVLTASAAGFQSATVTVPLAPSGFVISAPFSSGNFTTTSLSPATTFTVSPAVLEPSTLAYRTGQMLRGGLPPVSVLLVSSDTQVAAIAGSPLIFNAGDSNKTGEFRPVAPGSTIVSVTPPSGFAIPSNMRQLLATVTSPGISLAGKPIGKDLQASMSFRLSAPAPTGGVTITVASGDPARVLLSNSSRAAGSATLAINVPAGVSDGTFYAQALSDSGSSQLTASAPRFNNGTSEVQLNPSGFSFTFARDIVTSVTAGNTFLAVGVYRLDPQTLNPVEEMEGRAGIGAVAVEVISSDPSVGSITSSPLIFNAGDREKSTQFRPLAPGSTSVTVSVPPGFVRPARDVSVTATVR